MRTFAACLLALAVQSMAMADEPKKIEISGVLSIDESSGEGAIVLPDVAVVYENPSGELVQTELRAGASVTGYMGFFGAGGGAERFQFEEKDGRVHVAYFPKGDKGRWRSGWMRPQDLARFRYSSGCSGGGPFVPGFSMRWNSCFREARDAKLENLSASARHDAGR